MRRVGGGPGANIGGATQNKHLDAKIVKRRSLFMDMVGNDPVRSRALDEDIKGRSRIGARHGEWNLAALTREAMNGQSAGRVGMADDLHQVLPNFARPIGGSKFFFLWK
jgi:hypothetical protein